MAPREGGQARVFGVACKGQCPGWVGWSSRLGAGMPRAACARAGVDPQRATLFVGRQSTLVCGVGWKQDPYTDKAPDVPGSVCRSSFQLHCNCEVGTPMISVLQKRETKAVKSLSCS